MYVPPKLGCAVYVQVINSQSVATASPHVQLVQIPQSAISQFCGPAVGTIAPTSLVLYAMFYDGVSNQILPSWYEGFDGSNHYWFVRIATSIVAGAVYPLWLYIYPQQVINGTTVGVNAYYAQKVLGQSYGWNDNGTNVFYLYWNFQGTALPPGVASYTCSSCSLTVNNGVTMSAYNGYVFIYSSNIVAVPNFSQLVNYGFAVRTLFVDTADSSSTNDRKVFLGYGITGSSTALDNGYGYFVMDFFGSGNTYSYIAKAANGWTSLASVSDSDTLNTPMIGYALWYGSTIAWWRYNYTNYSLMKNLSVNDTSYTRSQVNEIGLSSQSGTTAYATITYYTVAVFDAPPNGVMPAVTTLYGYAYPLSVGAF